jgi:hypothetical protein
MNKKVIRHLPTYTQFPIYMQGAIDALRSFLQISPTDIWPKIITQPKSVLLTTIKKKINITIRSLLIKSDLNKVKLVLCEF